MLSLQNVHKRYGLRTIALGKVNLDIQEREFFVLYGPAGAGKSTLLNLIAGIGRPTSGDIQFRGQSIVNTPSEQRNIAMAFENYALYSHLSVGDNLGFPLRAKGVARSEVQERVHKMATTLGLEKFLDRRPGFLSGGQRQRVALGRAIIRPADIYLLDEPIGHLDAKLRHRMRSELKALANELDATVILTTTSSKEALALADRLAVINHGRIEQVGTPSTLYHQPVNTFVGSFVGDPPMSFISVDARHKNGSINLETVDGTLLGEVDSDLVDQTNLKVGIRAGSLKLTDTEKNALKVKVRVVEHLGYVDIAVSDLGDDEISVTLPTELKVKPGDSLNLAIDKEQLQLFDGNQALDMRVT